jgi:mRNA-degrading endonuclease RelE of RelBE toxin-antitoxin system
VPTFRLRIGDYRAVHQIIEDVITILAIVGRKDLDRILRGLR